MNKSLSALLMATTLACSHATFACDPIAPNWEAFYEANDKNRDKKLQRSEWQNLNFEGSYYDAGFESRLPPQQIFTQMDKNKNNVIDGDEIYELWTYLPNPCAEFDRRNGSDNQNIPRSVIEKLKQWFTDFLN